MVIFLHFYDQSILTICSQLVLIKGYFSKKRKKLKMPQKKTLKYTVEPFHCQIKVFFFYI